MKILHLVPSIGPDSFGLGQVALNLAKEQLNLGLRSQIWCLDSDENVQWATQTSGFPQKEIRQFEISGPKFLRYSRQMAKEMVGFDGQSIDVVHQHGIWTALSYLALSWSTKTNGIKVIAPHGSLQPWALNLSPRKKKIASILYEKNNLSSSSCLHATSANEIMDFRNFGLINPIALMDNGIPSVWTESQGQEFVFRENYLIPKEKRIMLFLSRITPKKGLPMLLDAIMSLRNLMEDWILLIAGTDEFNHKKEIEKIISDNFLSDIVKIIGPLYGQNKRDAFAASDFFVLPSHSEGAPIIVLEALGAGVPVLTTKASPWKDLERLQCGWWTDISTFGLINSLSEALSLSKPKLREMGNSGRELVERQYTWVDAANKSLLLYEWLRDTSANKPNFINL